MTALLTGCGGTAETPSATESSATTTTAAPVAAVATLRQFDPQWMTLAMPATWTEANRRITSDFQQFGLRPAGETELPRGCNGCGVEPATAYVTVYAAGKYDPAQIRSAQPLTVNAGNDGFYRASTESENAVLAWQYADNSWATVRGTTTITSESDRMLELARTLAPRKLTAIRVPLSIPGVPDSMPLAEISVDRGNYGTTLEFAQCGATDVGRIPPCQVESENMSVQIWPTDDPNGHMPREQETPAKIGGRDGKYGPDGRSAFVQVMPGMSVVFTLNPPSGQPPSPGHVTLNDILASLTWASDPATEQSWAPVTEWTKAS